MVWLPAERVLFAGDILVEDGVTMMVDGFLARAAATRWPGSIRWLRVGGARTWGALRAAGRPGGADPRLRPRPSIRDAGGGRRRESRCSVRLATLPPADENRPVSLGVAQRRNAVRVYVEEEHRYMGLDSP
jgi:hypothetical protein